jgi:hypothetical protein
MTKRINVATLPVIAGTLYPPPFDEPCRARQRTRLADVARLSEIPTVITFQSSAFNTRKHNGKTEPASA